MPKGKHPRYIIYKVDEKEFHICLEAKGKFLRWRSNYVPSMDIRFPREVSKIKDIPTGKVPGKNIFDRGTYTTNRKDTKTVVEQKVTAGIKESTFAVILDGNKLKGRFAFKKVQGTTIIQKYKDKYAVEEDVYEGDLLRTINLMVPDYDESKVYPERPKKRKKQQQPETEETIAIEEEITANKTIGNAAYYFAFYKSEDEPDICLVTNDAGEAAVFQRHGKNWRLLKPIKHTALRHQEEFIAHIKTLFSL